MVEIVCLDSMVVIWGVKREASLGQENMITKASKYLAQLDSQRAKIMVPTIVLSEILIKVPESDHAKILTIFKERFIVPPVDVSVAAKLAQIWRKHEKDGTLKIPDNPNSKLKNDCQIVATAVVHGANAICSHDPFLKQFAQGWIDVHEIPVIEEQSGLNFR